MAWVSRTSRDNHWFGLNQDTTVKVGPGSYNLNSGLQARKGIYAPFGSTDNRKFEASGNLLTPGPGVYDIQRDLNQSSATSSAFRSKTKRDEPNSTSDLPGPGAYDVMTYPAKKKQQARAQVFINSSSSGTKSPSHDWVKVPTAPSIPAAMTDFGYTEGSAGQIIPQQRVVVDHTTNVGPGAYHPNIDYLSDHHSRKTNFSTSKTKRFARDQLKQQHDLPGPGSYDTSTRQKLDKEPCPSSMFKSTVAKIHKPQEMKNLPGPGSYSLPSSIRREKKPEHLQFFGSTKVRFEDARYEKGPGPGSYGIPSQQKDFPQQQRQKNQRSTRKGPSVPVAFTSKQERFNPGQTREERTGPGSYDHSFQSIASDLEKKLAGKTGAFGSSSRRFMIKHEEQVSSSFSQEHYQQEKGIDELQHAVDKKNRIEKKTTTTPSAIFASSSARLNASVKDSGPSPGLYSINQPWCNKIGKGVLESGTKRFITKSNVDEGPGPGTYTSNKPSSTIQMKNGQFLTEVRFKHKKASSNPGPGAYSPDLVQGDLNSPTFNISIAEEMEKVYHREQKFYLR